MGASSLHNMKALGHGVGLSESRLPAIQGLSSGSTSSLRVITNHLYFYPKCKPPLSP